MSDAPTKTPIIELLRRIPLDANVSATVMDTNGFFHSISGINNTMHEAAAVIEKLQEELKQPANVDLPKIQHILSRDQRDALVAANVFLSVMQAADTELFNRLQGVIDEISDMLYEE